MQRVLNTGEEVLPGVLGENAMIIMSLLKTLNLANPVDLILLFSHEAVKTGFLIFTD